MPAHCAVVNCSDKYVHAGSISFHRFPFKRKDLLQQWKDFTQRSAQWLPSKWSAVCSRHFLASDFSCCNNRKTLKKNAVPTLRVEDEPEQQEQQPEQSLASVAVEPALNGVKSLCRFCGLAALRCVSFDNSFEIFGMIQKCFPTLQILQDDDTLPRDICSDCYSQLQRFSRFCDVVMLAQSELQRKDQDQLRRQLKIKQEPLVRVKQEACESLDNLFPDELDMVGLEEACCGDHEPCIASEDQTEQKFQFCDFPTLNIQDVINNCDIMEIINLDDPFINIPDDTDVAPAHAGPTAQELLLNEEHNYAKEEWQPGQYKTEKLEFEAEQPEPRSSKPIVTNVSQISANLSELLPPSSSSLAKHNIVVLNDSVVQSSAAFRLHNCSLCSAKFFSLDSLSQHYNQSHASPLPAAAMVSLPPPFSLSLANPTDCWSSSTPETWLGQSTPLPKKKINILDMQRSFVQPVPPPAPPPASSQPLGPVPAPSPAPQLASNYAKLSAKLRRLQKQCRKLKRACAKSQSRFSCRLCSVRCSNLRQLLRHRRLRRHFVAKPSIFNARCCGCGRLFRSRLALRQHMRYICQSLPLRSQRLQSFKCRHCQAITFTHWRLYRRHELKCRPRIKRGLKQIRRRPAPSIRKSCNICQKTFSSATGLKQHRITHSTERRYKCSLCPRVFKRRNGLQQHIKGFHLQLKPHECPVCRHRYALKCDMLRCRHSQRRGCGANE